MAVRRALGQIDDDGDAGLLGRLSKVHGGRDQAFLDRPDEVSGFDPFHRRTDGIDVLEIAGDKFRAEDPQRLRSGIHGVCHGSNIKANGQRFPDCGPAGVAGGA